MHCKGKLVLDGSLWEVQRMARTLHLDEGVLETTALPSTSTVTPNCLVFLPLIPKHLGSKLKSWESIFAAGNRNNHEPTQHSDLPDSFRQCTQPSASQNQEAIGLWHIFTRRRIARLVSLGFSPWDSTMVSDIRTSACDFHIMGARLGYFKATTTLKASLPKPMFLLC